MYLDICFFLKIKLLIFLVEAVGGDQTEVWRTLYPTPNTLCRSYTFPSALHVTYVTLAQLVTAPKPKFPIMHSTPPPSFQNQRTLPLSLCTTATRLSLITRAPCQQALCGRSTCRELTAREERNDNEDDVCVSPIPKRS